MSKQKSKQKSKWNILTVLSLLLSVAIAPQAIAQDFMGMFTDANQAAVNFAGNLAVGSSAINAANNAAHRPTNRSNRSSNRSNSGTSGTRPAASNLFTAPAPAARDLPRTTDFTFQPSAEVSRQFRAQYIARYASSDRPDVVQFRQLLEMQTWVSDFRTDANAYGLNGNDVADAMTGYWVRTWMVVNDQPAPSIEQVHAVNRQIRAGLATNPNFAQMSDAERQEVAELLIYQQSLAYGLYKGAVSTGATEKKQQLQQMVNATMMQSGIDLTQMDLTNSGFQVRS
jgi:hypothetical protein